MGPGTRLDLQLNPDGTPKPDSTPKPKSDYASYQHDIAYDRAKKAYEVDKTPGNRRRQLNKIWEADATFVEQMNNDTEEPLAPIAGKLIQTKEQLEKFAMLKGKEFDIKQLKNLERPIRRPAP